MKQNTYQAMDDFHNKYMDLSLSLNEAKRQLKADMTHVFTNKQIEEYFSMWDDFSDCDDNNGHVLLKKAIQEGKRIQNLYPLLATLRKYNINLKW